MQRKRQLASKKTKIEHNTARGNGQLASKKTKKIHNTEETVNQPQRKLK